MISSKIFQGYQYKGGVLMKGEADVSWGKFPTKEWGDGVSSAMIGFSKVYDWIEDGINWTEDDILDFSERNPFGEVDDY